MKWLAVLATILGATAMAMADAKVAAGEHPRLVFTKAHVPALIEKSKTPEGQAIVAQLRRVLAQPPKAVDIAYHAAGHGLLHVLGDPAAAQTARDLVEQTLADKIKHSETSPGTARREIPLWNSTYKAIIRTEPAVGVALAYDLCYEAWEPSFRQRVAKALDAKAAELIKGGGEGWNPSPASNWHANTRSGAGICALAVLGDEGAPGSPRNVDDARRGVLAYFEAQAGDRGWTQESFGYYRYPVCHHLLPFIQAWRNVMGDDPFKGTAADWYALFYLQLLLPDPPMGDVPIVNGFGLWENNHWRSGDFAMGMGTLPPEKRAALLWLADPWFGLKGNKSFDVFLPHHAIFALANWPVGVQAVNPEKVLSRAWEDRKKGLYIFRNRWQDGDDIVAVFDMNLNSVSGTGQPEIAGGFRIFGLGGKFAAEGWNPRGRLGESVVIGPIRNAKASGQRLHAELHPDGSGVVSVDLGELYTGKAGGAIRSFAVDYSGACGAPGLFVLADQFADKAARTWTLQTQETPSIHEDGSFTLKARGGSLHGTFVHPPGLRLAVQEGQITLRAAGVEMGQKKAWKLSASGGDGTGYLVVMTLQKDKPPAVRISGKGMEATATVGGVAVRYDGKKIVLEQ